MQFVIVATVLACAGATGAGCSERVDRRFALDAGDDAGEDSGAEGTPPACVCDVEWVRIITPDQSPIRCDARGDCSADAVCVPVLPLTEDPTCRFR